MSDVKCVSGCKHFNGGEIKHHKDCPYYSGSLSELYDNQLLDFANFITIELIDHVDTEEIVQRFLDQSENQLND